LDLLDSCTEVHFVVTKSEHPTVYNSGGDLSYFADLILRKDKQALLEYGLLCLELIHWLMNGGKRGVTTVAYVAGDALGGGFECALACNYIIAEKQSVFSFPEILFGLFPGMGGLAMFARYVGITEADRAWTASTLYTADRLHELNAVYLVTQQGAGEAAVNRFIAERNRKQVANEALQTLKRRIRPIPHDSLTKNVTDWVDAALSLSPKYIRRIQRICERQDSRAERRL
jgi:DSF synthase